MSVEALRSFLAWCTVVNFAVLIIWGIMMMAAGARIRQLHGNLFSLSEESVGEIHLKAMAYYKIGIVLFNLTPYLVLRFTA